MGLGSAYEYEQDMLDIAREKRRRSRRRRIGLIIGIIVTLYACAVAYVLFL